MPKVPTIAPSIRRHNPLADDVLSAGHLRTKSNKRKSRADEEDGNDYVDAKASRRILQIGQDLAQEDAEEAKATVTISNPAFDFNSRFDRGNDSDDEPRYGDEDAWGDEEEEVEEVVCFRHSCLDMRR
jgi:essential nuclear protein 1